MVFMLEDFWGMRSFAVTPFLEAQKKIGDSLIIDYDATVVSNTSANNIRLTGNSIMEYSADFSKSWTIPLPSNKFKVWYGHEIANDPNSFSYFNSLGAAYEIHYTEDACTSCHPTCLTCNGPAENECLKCMFGYEFDAGSGYCKKMCAAGEYWSHESTSEVISDGKKFTISQACLKCHQECKTCDGPGYNQCSSCSVDRKFYFQNKTCKIREQTCQKGQYRDINGSDTESCKACHAKCSQCTGPSASNCTHCAAP
jgi:hypothetical protein